MRRLLLSLTAAALLSGAGRAWAADPHGGVVLNLSCIEALAAIGADWLVGVFSFVPDRDSPLAFADMLVRNERLMGKFLKKLKKDLKVAGGVTVWDHKVVLQAMAIYASPVAAMLKKPAKYVTKDLDKYSLAPTMTLAEVAARRRAKGRR